jgi:bifunctional non-homologous end joining protein LigD
MADIFDILPLDEREALKKTGYPTWMDPMLAVLADEAFSREGWIFEPKLDGERCITYKQGKDLKLMSRNQKILNGGYSELVGVLEKESRDFVIDGEVVAFENGHSSFKKLQGRIGLHDMRANKKEIPIFYYVFDLLYLDGFDTRKLKLRWRKKLLKEAIDFTSLLRFIPHIQTRGEEMYKKACRNGEEGVMAKDFDGLYTSTRSSEWLKFKCSNSQEFVIGGYTPGSGRREGFLGAILVGYYNNGKLMYAGKVGAGFSDQALAELTAELEKLKQEEPPFSGDVQAGGKVTWVKPKLVAQITYGEWTQYDRLRIPRYQGLRRDKPASQVLKEG